MGMNCFVHQNNEFTVLVGVLRTVKPVLSGHLKIDKTKVLKENDSSPWSILQYC